MAITIANQENVTANAGVAVQVLPARVGRKAASIQLQEDGVAWLNLGGTAAVGDGMRIGGWQIVDLSVLVDALVGDGTNFYEGTVSLFWEGGGVKPGSNAPQNVAFVRVIEGS